MRDAERAVPRGGSEKSIDPVLSALREQGSSLSPIKRLPGGVWGAWLVRDQRGDVAILKCIWDSDWRPRLESARQVVELLRVRNAPVPRYLASGFDPQVGTWCLQERLLGDRVRELDTSLLGQVLSFTDLQADIGSGLPLAYNWTRRVQEWMSVRADPTIDIMSDQSQRGRTLASRLQSIVAACRDEEKHTEDVVHGDFLATQLLVRDAHLSGVVDWDAAGRGDRCQDLALLFYNTFAQADRHKHPVDENVITALAAHSMALCGAERFGWFLAYEILTTFAFVLEHNPAHVSWRTDLGQRVIERYSKAAGAGI